MVGPVDIDPAKPHAFLSYTRFDDTFLKDGISALREALEQAVQARTGRPFNIFQDVDDIKPGDAWQKKLDRAIEAAQLFIPILTPSFFESKFCRDEAEAFLNYEARAGRGDLVLPIYLIDTPKLDDAGQRAADDIASRLHERQYDDWRPLRFRLQHPDTLPRIDELAGAIASAIARNGKAATPPPQPTRSAEVEDRLATLEGRIEDRDQAIATERSRREHAEAALTEEKAKTRELAEAPALFEGQIEEARKRENVLSGEIASLEAQITERDDTSVKQRLAEAEAALEEERAKGEQIARAASVIPWSFYLASAALALLVGAGGWLAGQGMSSSPDVELLRTQNQELTNELHDRTAELEEARSAPTASSDVTEASPGRQALEPLSTFRDCSDCPEMVVIPAGSFFMGSRESEAGSEDDERPRHKVDLQSFALGKYEVTFAEWGACVAAGGCDHGADDEGWGGGNLPVINVNWKDAQQYVAWLSRETGETYRLPSEAEWEYAARAFPLSKGLNPPAYAFGDSIKKEQANFGGHIGKPVGGGSYQANEWGLHDMHGNVWEWVEDSWYGTYDGAPTDGRPWLEGNETNRVHRGGSWTSSPDNLRSANRSRVNPDNRNDLIGFRVYRTLTP